ncbi:MAG: MBL fold metallo-hydrolase [Dehalococcoidales bacterium]|nr:MBL fold metallo-hydrolase [Dehalococcoidales bacterium]
MIVDRLVVGPFKTNCYIVGVAGVGMIIDPGAEAKRVLQRVSDLELDIKLIALTHGHIDHVGGLKEVSEATGAMVAMHSGDTRLLYNPALAIAFSLFYPRPPFPDRLLEDGDNLDIGGMRFTVLHTPGHTPGGVCFLGEGVVFSGDTLFRGSIGRTDLPGGSFRQLVSSIRSQLMVLADNIAVYPGHGAETTIGAERANPYLE